MLKAAKGTSATTNPTATETPTIDTPNTTQTTETAVQTTPQGGAVGAYTGPIKLMDLNPNLGLDDNGLDGKSRVKADGTELVYKKIEGLRVSDLLLPGTNVLVGQKIWQWWPKKDDQGNQIEEGGMCMSIDGHKTSVDGLICANCANFKRKDNPCKMKYELDFREFDPAQGEFVEHCLDMSTTSAIAFTEYVKALTRGEVASKEDKTHLQSPKDPRRAVTFGPNGNSYGWYVHPERGEFKLPPNKATSLAEVVTRVTVRRVEKQINGQKVIWSQMVFQAVGYVDDWAAELGLEQVG